MWLQAEIRAARLYQRATLLRLAALELHCADLAVQDASCKALLQDFFLPLDTDEDTGMQACTCQSCCLFICICCRRDNHLTVQGIW